MTSERMKERMTELVKLVKDNVELVEHDAICEDYHTETYSKIYDLLQELDIGTLGISTH